MAVPRTESVRAPAFTLPHGPSDAASPAAAQGSQIVRRREIGDIFAARDRVIAEYTGHHMLGADSYHNVGPPALNAATTWTFAAW